MSVIVILVIVGIVVAGIFLIGFIWAVNSGQYDDMYSPSVRILFDNNDEQSEDKNPSENKQTNTTQNKNIKPII